MQLPSREPYRQSARKLVIAFDIGTTQSGVSFALLDPGQIPIIQGVTRFPGQQSIGGSTKVPSVICYDSYGNNLASGEDAVQMSTNTPDDDDDLDSEDSFNAEDVQQVIQVKWFKLRLFPAALSASHIEESNLPPLPNEKTAVDVLSDLLIYLYTCTQNYIEETIPSGERFWNAEGNAENIEFVLTHPNGWKEAQQSQLRQAAISAGLIIEDTSSALHLATEGEASLHHFVNRGILKDISDGDGVLIIDAGGGMIDISSYQKIAGQMSFAEIAKPASLAQGSAMVSVRAKSWLLENLRGSKYEKDVDRITQVFDDGPKLTFKDAATPIFIRFGETRDTEARFDIRSGQKKISGSTIATFFAPCIDSTVLAINEQLQKAKQPVKTAYMIGGFAANDWMYSEIQRQLPELKITRPTDRMSKAVADGAVSFYLDHLVTTRVTDVSPETTSPAGWGSWFKSAFIPRWGA